MNERFNKINSGLLADRKVTQLMVITAGTFAIFSLVSRDIFFSSANFTSMAYQIPEIAILSIAVMLSMLTGGIDLSIVAISNAAALVAAWIMTTKMGESETLSYSWIIIACVVGTLVGLAAGAVNSIIIARLDVTPILATLATGTLFNGIAIGITDGVSVSGLPENFMRVGNGTFLGIPTPFVLMVVIALAVGYFINRTTLGLKVFLVGTNRKAAQYSVMGDRKVIAWIYLISALLSSLAGLIIASRTSAASPDFGSSYILLAIVVVVLGGINPNGGFGTITGVILATAVLQMVSSGFNALRFSQFFYLAAQGAVLVFVMILNVVLERRRVSRSISKSLRS
ncbi:ABC transporter permease [Actinobacteria bacterium IMCC25003]|jgi:simple sugar transport system permease protein|nr:ABC transporter permease [Actinobacteria bacterium IMCC25003]